MCQCKHRQQFHRPFDIKDDVLSSHAVLVVIHMILIKDGCNFLSILANRQKRLLVVVGGNVELEHVSATAGAGKDASVNVKTTTNVAVCALEGKVLLTATIVSLSSVCIEVDTKGLAIERFQECVFLEHFGFEIVNVSNSLIIL